MCSEHGHAGGIPLASLDAARVPEKEPQTHRDRIGLNVQNESSMFFTEGAWPPYTKNQIG